MNCWIAMFSFWVAVKDILLLYHGVWHFVQICFMNYTGTQWKDVKIHKIAEQFSKSSRIRKTHIYLSLLISCCFYSPLFLLSVSCYFNCVQLKSYLAIMNLRFITWNCPVSFARSSLLMQTLNLSLTPRVLNTTKPQKADVFF